MQRTIVVQLKPTPEQAHVLKQTLDEHTACYNAVCQEGFTTQCSNGVELHKRTYYPLRAQYPKLPAQLVCAARVKATESVKSAPTWQKKYDAQYPKRVAKAEKQGKPHAIRRKHAAGAAIKPVTTVVLNPCFTVAPVAINSTRTTTHRKTFETSMLLVLPTSVHLRWWVACQTASCLRLRTRDKPPAFMRRYLTKDNSYNISITELETVFV